MLLLDSVDPDLDHKSDDFDRNSPGRAKCVYERWTRILSSAIHRGEQGGTPRYLVCHRTPNIHGFRAGVR